MGIVLRQEPELNNPDMIVGWPGIGNVGMIAVDAIRQGVHAKEFGEIEPWDFFYPNSLAIEGSILTELGFPQNKFYYRRLENRDLLFFIGEEQPAIAEDVYAQGKLAYEISNMVLDVAQKFGCRRIYASGAAVSIAHHSQQSGVWAVANSEALLSELHSYDKTMLMSGGEDRPNRGNITGLNGLLIGAAKRRGIDGICLMGQIPDYLSRIPFPYPKASKAIVETLAGILGINLDYTTIDDMVIQMEAVVSNVYQQFPQEIRERLERRKQFISNKREVISDEDKQWLKDHIDDFFNKDKGE